MTSMEGTQPEVDADVLNEVSSMIESILEYSGVSVGKMVEWWSEMEDYDGALGNELTQEFEKQLISPTLASIRDRIWQMQEEWWLSQGDDWDGTYPKLVVNWSKPNDQTA